MFLNPADFKIASKHDTKSALPARSPMPLIAVFIYASTPASIAALAPITEHATAIPKSLWKCVSIDIPVASKPKVSQYLNL